MAVRSVLLAHAAAADGGVRTGATAGLKVNNGRAGGAAPSAGDGAGAHSPADFGVREEPRALSVDSAYHT